MRYGARILATLSLTVAAVLGPVATSATAAATSGPQRLTPVPIASLRVWGTRTEVVVRGVRSAAQVRWIEHVLDGGLAYLDGCVGAGGPATLSHGVYRRHIDLLCHGGPARARAAVARLHATRPWYRLRTVTVAVTAFELGLRDPGSTGSPEAVPAALARLPHQEFFWADGDEFALGYAGTGVTQAGLDAAVAAFAAAQRVPLAGVRLVPLPL